MTPQNLPKNRELKFSSAVFASVIRLIIFFHAKESKVFYVSGFVFLANRGKAVFTPQADNDRK